MLGAETLSLSLWHSSATIRNWASLTSIPLNCNFEARRYDPDPFFEQYFALITRFNSSYFFFNFLILKLIKKIKFIKKNVSTE